IRLLEPIGKLRKQHEKRCALIEDPRFLDALPKVESQLRAIQESRRAKARRIVRKRNSRRRRNPEDGVLLDADSCGRIKPFPDVCLKLSGVGEVVAICGRSCISKTRETVLVLIPEGKQR